MTLASEKVPFSEPVATQWCVVVHIHFAKLQLLQLHTYRGKTLSTLVAMEEWRTQLLIRGFLTAHAMAVP